MPYNHFRKTYTDECEYCGLITECANWKYFNESAAKHRDECTFKIWRDEFIDWKLSMIKKYGPLTEADKWEVTGVAKRECSGD